MKIGGASSTSSWKAKRPAPVCGTSIENRFVRTSMLATFVPVTNSPEKRSPRRTSSDENALRGSAAAHLAVRRAASAARAPLLPPRPMECREDATRNRRGRRECECAQSERRRASAGRVHHDVR